ncbi:MAG: hypothetical protein IPO00_12600 [Betaproteobacteria bacterium]|nr:hypothetical protein [Betaproteobacteria bacterium]
MRPYFRSSIDDLESIFRSAESDLSVLRKLQQELAHREKPRARALKVKVGERLKCLTGQSTNTDYSHATPPSAIQARQVVTPPTSSIPDGTHPVPPDRIVVECARCKTPNFVSTLNGIVQHLSCSACRTPFEAQFKYGVMRTTFLAADEQKSTGSGMKWIFVVLLAALALVLLFKEEIPND